MKWVLYIFSFLLSFQTAFSQSQKVFVLNADCAIHPACADYIHSGVEKAKKENAECLIVRLNTPGGLLTSTRQIVKDFLESPIPIVVYVSPSGSQSASAGVFITMAANIAAMAPGTNIGAAHPVSLQGAQDSVMMGKATNDAAAFIRTISEKRKRNVQWAEDAVLKSVSITEREALEKNVIDLIAKDIAELLEKINGKQVETSQGMKIINTKNAKVIYIEMTLAERILSILSDPNFAYILLMLGIYGLFFELYNPGAILPGVIGGICLILAFYSLSTLPVNYAGLALIIFAVVLFILEIKVVSHGILSIGGIISLLLGSMMLIKEESVLEAMEISMSIIILIVVLTALFFLFAIAFAIKAQRKKPVTGSEGLVGETGIAYSSLKPKGEVKVHGEIWNAESIDGEIKRGEEIRVTKITNLKLFVKRIDKN
ncbi:MAG: nodulation protein NfeD [Ignavibacteriaceae bacterium]|nr:nodulation protein NfeD [Chlorobium sp.]MCW8818245.1 nodulation protein NfeD [Ignavibacteriaceae bacterium]MCW8824583.1 nodulation protein NfeD [Ignavibacteriaceae bacterium]MCW9095342.1 nodulation protein NfeD [Ignavibacteriaceae bacterium]MCW9095779.1 nodulation protein NfeD [Ignavibacteriaceae bacterium]